MQIAGPPQRRRPSFDYSDEIATTICSRLINGEAGALNNAQPDGLRYTRRRIMVGRDLRLSSERLLPLALGTQFCQPFFSSHFV